MFIFKDFNWDQPSSFWDEKPIELFQSEEYVSFIIKCLFKVL